jgi:histidinol-phosphate aminotransferase
VSAEQVIDFSVNSNPFGPAPQVKEALRAVDISTYPDRECSRLRKMLASFHDLPEDILLAGNGTSELIWLIAQAFLKAGDRVLIVGPTFGEYRRAARAQAAEISEVRAQAPLFQIPLEEIMAQIEANRPRLVFLCNPNNPTGQCLPPVLIRKLVTALPAGCLLVLDEAYRAFSDGFTPVDFMDERCIRLCSMTKDFALAGLRLGYALAYPDIIRQMKRRQPAWSVNAPAQAAGCAALEQLDYYRQTLLHLQGYQATFFAGLQAAGFFVVPSRVHFGLVLLDVPATEVREGLLRQSLLVRDCASFGLPQAMRVSTHLPVENDRLIAALKRLRAGREIGG